MTRLTSMLGAAAVVAVAGLGLGGSASGLLVSPAQAQTAEQTAEQPAEAAQIVEMTLGAEDAPVTIVEYASFTCPHCATFHNGPMKQLKADYIDTGKVRLIYREVYFDRFGLWASAVARCGGPEKFFGIADLIYRGQGDWTKAGGPAEIVDELRKIGRLAGIEAEPLEACLQDGEMLQALVGWYQGNAQTDGIESTPTFLINGEKVPNQAWDSFKAIIDGKL